MEAEGSPERTPTSSGGPTIETPLPVPTVNNSDRKEATHSLVQVNSSVEPAPAPKPVPQGTLRTLIPFLISSISYVLWELGFLAGFLNVGCYADLHVKIQVKSWDLCSSYGGQFLTSDLIFKVDQDSLIWVYYLGYRRRKQDEWRVCMWR